MDDSLEEQHTEADHSHIVAFMVPVANGNDEDDRAVDEQVEEI